jgi:phage terminase small subunit
VPTPSKPLSLIKGHRTKAEKEQRAKAEADLITGRRMKIWPETADNEKARQEFNRVRALLHKIEKDDALHESVVNRYALLRAECLDFEEKREAFTRRADELEETYESGHSEMKPFEYFKLIASLQGQVVALDKQIQAKRKMLLDIEKENIMTIASALRSIPKKVEKKDKPSGISSFMSQRNGNGG